MHAVGVIVAILGIVNQIVGWLWLVILVFRESRLMGYVALLCFHPLAFAILFINWEESKKPFFIWLAGLALTFLGMFLMGPS